MTTKKQFKTLIIVFSYHHNNTLKIAQAFALELGAQIITPNEIDSVNLIDYDLIGFGSGIDSGKHYKPLITLAETLPSTSLQKGFVFSTSAIQGKAKVEKDHFALRTILSSKGYAIIDEFSCKGYNTNSFLKYFGGMNKGHPDEKDLNDAKNFAKRLESIIESKV